MTDKKIIALIFDFDDTLAPDSTSSFLASSGIDLDEFWNSIVNPLLEDDWDPIPAYLYGMIKLSDSNPTRPITRNDLIEFGKKLEVFPGVAQFLEKLKLHAKDINPETVLEYYIISSGIGDIIRSSPIASYFTNIWASEFHFDVAGRINFPKKVVSFTDKTRYLFMINKGLIGKKSIGKPFEVNKRVQPDEMRVPIENMIYVGDGYTDIPCFSIVKRYKGYSIGVYDKKNRKKFEQAWGFVRDERVSTLVAADFAEDSDLCMSLYMAVESIAKKHI